MRPWRIMISAIVARSGGPPAAALITSADSRKYCGPIAAGVITQSAFTSWAPLLSKRLAYGRQAARIRTRHAVLRLLFFHNECVPTRQCAGKLQLSA